MKTQKSKLTTWVDRKLSRDSVLRSRVEETLGQMRIEQDIVALRAARGLSQRDLARLLRVSQPAIAKIESGRVRNIQMRTLARLATALGATLRVEIVKGRHRERKTAR